jgi:hypothetical protein
VSKLVKSVLHVYNLDLTNESTEYERLRDRTFLALALGLVSLPLNILVLYLTKEIGGFGMYWSDSILHYRFWMYTGTISCSIGIIISVSQVIFRRDPIQVRLQVAWASVAFIIISLTFALLFLGANILYMMSG